MEDPPLTLRRADIADSETVFRLHVNSVQVLCRRHYSETHLEAWFVGRSSANYLPAIREGALWIAERDAEAVGFTEFFPGLISMLFVAGDASGAGTGSRLLAFALEGAGAARNLVRLESTLNARRFYERHGFVAVGTSCLVRDGDIRIPTVKMEHRPASLIDRGQAC